MRTNQSRLFTLFALLSSCSETHINAPGDTTTSTSAPASDTMVDTTSTGASTTAAASTSSAEAGHDAGDTSTTDDTHESTTTASEETTGAAQPVCGNGVVEEFGWTPEECDDGNLLDGDGCDADCAADRTIFVSSIRYKAAELKGLHLADAKCINMAHNAGLFEPTKFHAFLSDSTIHARDRFNFSRGRLVLVNGLVVADSWIDLLAGKLQNPIEVTELSETYHGGVWTGSTPQGTAVPNAQHCADWTSNEPLGHYGTSDSVTAEWALVVSEFNPGPCGLDYAIYCLSER